MLEARGTLVVRQLCELLEPRQVFVTFAAALQVLDAPKAAVEVPPAGRADSRRRVVPRLPTDIVLPHLVRSEGGEGLPAVSVAAVSRDAEVAAEGGSSSTAGLRQLLAVGAC